jgi:hypothetical protein
MLVDSSNSAAGSSVTGAIRQASEVTGTSFNYLLATAKVESGLNPQAGASTSSARGLFQFIEQTWLGTMKQSGTALGYGRYADAITKTSSGHYQVNDPEMRREILKLRNDPTTNAVMAGAFTKANAELLSQKLGRAPSEGELYIAHFLGVGGAARLISLAASDPNAKATDYFPGVANANSSIFYDRSTGAARTLAQVRNVLTARYDVAARSRPGDSPGAAQAASSPGEPLNLAALTAPRVAANAPDTAGITSAFAAALPAPVATMSPVTKASGPAASAPMPAPPLSAQAAAESQMFHGLFQDTDRTAPIAAVVSQLWSVPLGTPVSNGGDGQRSKSGNAFDLFTDAAGS